MAAIKNVAIAGVSVITCKNLLQLYPKTSQAAGDLGEPVLKALVNSGKFNVTVLVRSASKNSFPLHVEVIEVDFTSVESLTKALNGQDALVSTVGISGLEGQTIMIDACVAAGVSRFLPSEFGSDLDNPMVKALPVFGYKVAVNKYAEEKARETPEFSYTKIRNAAFLDWGLEHSFIFDLKSGKPRIYDSGDQLFSATTLATVGQVVVGVLSNPEETKNRVMRVHDINISQNRILQIARKVAPSTTFEPYYASTAEILKDAYEKIGKGDYSLPVMLDFIIGSIFAEGSDGLHDSDDDNKLLGIAGKTDGDVEAIVKSLLA